MNPTDIRDIKGLVPLPATWWMWAVLFILLALLALAIFFLYRKRHRGTAQPNTVVPTPYDIALQQLRRLQHDGLIEGGSADEFYTRLSDIIRHYLEDRFQLHAPERTTEEFLQESARDGILAPAHQQLLGVFLQECDLVKFARLRPGSADRRCAFDAAERFLHETRPRLQEERRGGEHDHRSMTFR